MNERNINLKATPKQIIEIQKKLGFIPRTREWNDFFTMAMEMIRVQKEIHLQCCVRVLLIPLLSLFIKLPIPNAQCMVYLPTFTPKTIQM